MNRRAILTAPEWQFVADSRRAVLATTDPAGRSRLVPICHVLDGRGEARPRLYTPIDEKPKRSSDPVALGRVRDILVRPEVAVLVDRWSEDWTDLAWLRLHGTAALLEPDAGDEHRQAVALLRSKYLPYRSHRLEDRPLIRVTVERARSWGAIG